MLNTTDFPHFVAQNNFIFGATEVVQRAHLFYKLNGWVDRTSQQNSGLCGINTDIK